MTQPKYYLALLGFLILFVAQTNSVQAQNTSSKLPERCIPYNHSAGFETWMQRKISQRKTQRTTAEVITIPVVVHVIHNGEAEGQGTNISQAQIASQIRILNEDFRKKLNTNGHNTHPAGADLEIEFALAVQTPEGIPTTGIVRIKGSKYVWGVSDDITLKALSYWNAEDYLNIWVCDLDDFLGYAQFPETNVIGIPQNSTTKTPATDGIVVDCQAFGDTGNVVAPFHLGRTATHEVGHYLGLLHISGDGLCPTDDYCSDTPPVNHQSSGCPTTKPLACDGTSAQIENYMDYSDDQCMNMFTEEQKTRMRTVLENSPRRSTLKNSKGLETAVLAANNVNLAAITQIQNSACDAEIMPQIFIKNFGSNPLTSLTVTYDVDGANTQTYQWTGSLASLGSATVDLPALNVSRASHQFNVQATLPNGQADADAANNSLSQSFFVEPLYNLPLSYDFADTTVLNALWKIENPDNKTTWNWLTLPVQDQSTGNEAMMLPYFDYSLKNQEEFLISPLFDVSQIQNLTLEFRVAYAPFKDGDTFARDGLKVGITTDCGKTFTIIYEKYADTLATDEVTTDSWKPIRDNQWRTEKVNLNAWAGKSNLQIAFIGLNGYGNNIYIDDVLLNDVPIITNPDDFILVAPNPIQDNNIQVSFRLPTIVDALQWSLFDVSGRKVTEGQLHNIRSQTMTLPVAHYQSGVYILKVSTANYTVTKRIMLK